MYQKRIKHLGITLMVILVVALAGATIFPHKTFKALAAAEPTFIDVPADHPFFDQIEAVASANYMSGWEIREFRPSVAADRATVSYVIAHAYNKLFDNSNPTFSDVPRDYWAYQEIEGLYAAGWISGYPDGTFHPEEAADRQTVAAFFAKAHSNGNVPSDPDGIPHFSDCKNVATCWAYNEIEYLASLDPPVISGYPDGTFDPSGEATRSTLAVILAREQSLDIGNPPAVPSFQDVPTTDPSYGYIEAVYHAGYMVGYLLYQEFRPDLDADRATVAVVIARASNKFYEPDAPTFIDVPKDHWAFREIEGLNRAGIMTGWDSGNGEKEFRPTDTFDRRSMAIVLARAKNLDLSDPGKTNTFVDVLPTDPGYSEIEAIYKANFTQGCDQNEEGLFYCPDRFVIRSELAVFVYNAYLNLDIAKSVDKFSASSGEIITYTMSYSNPTETTYQNVKIHDTIPSGATYVDGSASGGGVYNPVTGKIIWDIGDLAPDAQGAVNFEVQVN